MERGRERERDNRVGKDEFRGLILLVEPDKIIRRYEGWDIMYHVTQ